MKQFSATVTYPAGKVAVNRESMFFAAKDMADAMKYVLQRVKGKATNIVPKSIVCQEFVTQ